MINSRAIWTGMFFITLAFLWPSLGFSEEPGGVALGSKVKITASTPKLNRNTGAYDVRVTLKNRSKPKQPIYGPLTLVVSQLSRSDVTLSNASGQTSQGLPYLTINLPQAGLAPRKTVKNIALNFNNPTRTKFKARYTVYGFLAPQTVPLPVTVPSVTGLTQSAATAALQNAGLTLGTVTQQYSDTVAVGLIMSQNPASGASVAAGTAINLVASLGKKIPPEISQVSPNSAPTGAVITISGAGFAPTQKVSLGDKEIINPRINSSTELEITIPFDVDGNGGIVPLAPGKYPIKIDGAPLYDFTVTVLPENPNPPGVVLTNVIDNLSQSFIANQATFQSILQELKDVNTDPASQELLDLLATLLQNTSDVIYQELPLVPSRLGPQTLDVLERALLENNLNETPPIATASNFRSALAASRPSAFSPTDFRWFTDLLLGKPAFAAFSLPGDPGNNPLPGDQWLADRLNRVTTTRYTQELDKVNTLCDWVIALSTTALITPATPYELGACAVLKVTTIGVKIFQDILMTEIGRIADLGISVNPESAGSFAVVSNDPLNLTSQKHLKINVSNVDSPYRALINPTITVRHDFDIVSMMRYMLQFASIGILSPDNAAWRPVLDTLDKIAAGFGRITNQVLKLNNKDVQVFPISFSRVGTDCVVTAQDANLADYLNIEPLSGDIKVTDNPKPWTVTTDAKPFACTAAVKEEYRTGLEKSANMALDFVIQVYTPVTVTKSGAGKGSITGSVYGDSSGANLIDCGGDCPSQTTSITYMPGGANMLILTAKPEAGFIFAGWSGDACSAQSVAPDGSLGTCTVPMDGIQKSIDALFTTSCNTSHEGGGTLIAPGYWSHNYNIKSFDASSCANGGTLTITGLVGTGISAASFDIFLEDQQITSSGYPISCGHAYDLRPGSYFSLNCSFSKGQILKFGAEGNWFSPTGATNSYTYHAVISGR